jgi:hypothetical protein
MRTTQSDSFDFSGSAPEGAAMTYEEYLASGGIDPATLADPWAFYQSYYDSVVMH